MHRHLHAIRSATIKDSALAPSLAIISKIQWFILSQVWIYSSLDQLQFQQHQYSFKSLSLGECPVHPQENMLSMLPNMPNSSVEAPVANGSIPTLEFTSIIC